VAPDWIGQRAEAVAVTGPHQCSAL